MNEVQYIRSNLYARSLNEDGRSDFKAVKKQ